MFKLVIFTKGILNSYNAKLFRLLAQDPEIEISAIIVDNYKPPSKTFSEKILRFKSLHKEEFLFKAKRKIITKSQRLISEIFKSKPGKVQDHKSFAEEFGINVIFTENINSIETIETVKTLEVDLGVISGSRILAKDLIKTPRLGTLNIHKRLLPFYRGGGAPLYWEALNNEKQIGVTIHMAEAQVDAGNIIAEEIIPVGEYENLESAKIKTDSIGCFLYYKTIKRFTNEIPCGKSQELSKGKEYRYAGEFAEYSLNKKLREKTAEMPRLKRKNKSTLNKVADNLKYLLCYPYLSFIRKNLASKRQAPVVIFFYHNVSNNNANAMTLPLEIFTRQINYLKKNYEIISLKEAKKRLSSGQNSSPAAVITFDDGYREDLLGTIPFLRANDIPATFFVSIGNCLENKNFSHDENKNYNLERFTEKDIRQISEWGFEIGSHGIFHENFNRLTAEESEKILQESRDKISNITGKPCESFSFPYGILYKDINLQNEKTAEKYYPVICHAWGGFNYADKSNKPLLRISAPDSEKEIVRIMNGYTGIKNISHKNPFGLRDKDLLSGFMAGKKFTVAFIETGSGEGGSTYSLLRILKTLKQNYSTTIEPIVVTINKKACDVFSGEGYRTILVGSESFFKKIHELSKIISTGQIDHIHCNNPPYEHIPFIIAGFTSGTPVTLHYRVSRNLTKAEKLILPLTKHIFAVSESGTDVLNNQGFGIQNKISMLGDGVIISDYQNVDTEKAKSEFGITETTFTILLPATLQPGKGQDTAVKAAKILKDKGIDIKWIFAGGEHYQFAGFENELKNRINENHLEDNIIIAGHRSDMPEILSCADLVIMPSRLTEGLPCAIMEAFAAGKPVIASDTGGMPEAVNENTGNLIRVNDHNDLAEKISNLYNDRRLVKLKSENAYKKAIERYDMRTIVEKMITAIFD